MWLWARLLVTCWELGGMLISPVHFAIRHSSKYRHRGSIAPTVAVGVVKCTADGSWVHKTKFYAFLWLVVVFCVFNLFLEFSPIITIHYGFLYTLAACYNAPVHMLWTREGGQTPVLQFHFFLPCCIWPVSSQGLRWQAIKTHSFLSKRVLLHIDEQQSHGVGSQTAVVSEKCNVWSRSAHSSLFCMNSAYFLDTY